MYVSQESFLKNSIRKHCLEPRAFVYSLAIFFLDVNIEWLCTHNSTCALKVEMNRIPVRGTVNRSQDNRGSTVLTYSDVCMFGKGKQETRANFQPPLYSSEICFSWPRAQSCVEGI
jgi:hypothetical protein